ncbi:MAG: DUF2007 domain-containing protein [Chloroflexi bacterium]|nr:DUF2007 domain-containing protein [Chloroflexota bacterium]MCL5109723.1 DUF2007 domain-containing protein [Chloroflexota bacterium]
MDNGGKKRDQDQVGRRGGRLHPAPLRGGENERLVRLATVHSEQLAQMYAEMLHNEGIPCVVKGAGGWSSALPTGMDEHYLLVPTSDLARASELLTGYGSPGEGLSLDLPQARAAGRGRRWRPQSPSGPGTWH